METNTQERRVLYSDTARIGKVMYCYKKSVPVLQGVIDALKSERVPITDEVLIDLGKRNGKETIAALKAAIDKEVKGQRFQATRDALLDQLEPLYTHVSRAVEAVNDALFHEGSMTINDLGISLRVDNFTVKNLTVTLIDGLEQVVTDRHSIYSDTDPELTAHFERAERLAAEITDFTQSLKQYGDYLVPSSTPDNHRSLVCAEINGAFVRPDNLQWFRTKKPKFSF